MDRWMGGWMNGWMDVLQERGLPPGPESGLLSNTQKWIVWGDLHANKARDFIGKGCLGRKQQSKGTRENCSAMWFTVSGFMVIGLVSSCLWPVILACIWSDSGFFLVVIESLSQDGFYWEGFREVGRTHVPMSLPSFWPLLDSPG